MAKATKNKADSATSAKLEEAKAKFAEAQKKLQEQRGAVAKAKRLIATGDKKIQALEKKIEETKDAPSKAVEMLLKKAEEMERKAAEMAAEQDEILEKASVYEEQIEEKQQQLDDVKKEADAELEALGVPKTTTLTRTKATGTAAERRQKNNFQYRLKSKGWEMNYNMKGRIESAVNYGLTVVFEQDQFSITGGTLQEEFKHPYGEGSLTALAQIVKEHGEGVEEE
jgi:chromosome segregation ATPase